MSKPANIHDAFANAEEELAALLSSKSDLQRSVATLREQHSAETQRLWREIDSQIEEVKVEVSHELNILQATRDSYLLPKTVFSDVVSLNVGGKVFTTTVVTLRKEKDSMLAAMFSGRYKISTDKTGAYFIDRDGALFHHILTYLRTGTLPIDLSTVETRRLRTEADFYGLASLQMLLDAEQRPVRSQFAVLQYTANFVPSCFLGPSPEGIDLFYFQGDCYRSCKDMTDVLRDMREAGWKLHLSVAPAHCGNSCGRLVFVKEDVKKE